MNIHFKYLIIMALVLFSACQDDNSTTQEVKISTVEKIVQKKRLDVVILNSPTVYYIGSQKELGFEYELISDYARSIGVDLNLSVVHTVHEALSKAKNGVGDIIVAGITQTEQREKSFKFGPKYDAIDEQLICHKHTFKSETIKKEKKYLAGLNILVAKGTSYERTLTELSKEIEGFSFKTSSNLSTEQILEEVNSRKIDCTVVDSNIFMTNNNYYPELRMKLVLNEKDYLAWIIKDKDDSLKYSLYEWLNKYEYSGKMKDTRNFYYSFVTPFDYYGTKTFYKHLKDRLPKYKKYFKAAAKKYDIPWMLLAAQSYQESHWNPKAKSPTGVRGIMMLTRNTAKSLGVTNRLDAKTNIYAGTAYLRKMEKRLPKEIVGKNRWAFTLAAYNIGMGHIHDAQTLARKLNKNPYLWSDLKEVLPLLSLKQYNRDLKYGYARGNEPVRYINSIISYVNIMQKNEP